MLFKTVTLFKVSDTLQLNAVRQAGAMLTVQSQSTECCLSRIALLHAAHLKMKPGSSVQRVIVLQCNIRFESGDALLIPVQRNRSSHLQHLHARLYISNVLQLVMRVLTLHYSTPNSQILLFWAPNGNCWALMVQQLGWSRDLHFSRKLTALVIPARCHS